MSFDTTSSLGKAPRVLSAHLAVQRLDKPMSFSFIYLRSISLNTFLLLVIWFIAYSGCIDNDKAYNVTSQEISTSVKSTFEQHFKLKRKTTLRGTADAPIYSTGYFEVTENSFIIPDEISHQVIHFTRAGDFIASWGREGNGPGEFKAPNWAGTDKSGKIYIREGTDNFRVQVFDIKGALLESFPLYAFGPFTQSFLSSEDGKVTFTTTTRVHCGEGDALCVMQEQDISGEVVKRYAPELEVEKNRLGLPFIAGKDNDDHIYVAHRNGKRVAIYSKEGVLVDAFPIDNAPEVKVLDTSNLSRDPVKRIQEKANMKYTIIRGIYPVKEFIFIDFFRVNSKENDVNNFMNIYDKSGKLQYHGIDMPYPLEKVKENSFFFVQENEDTDYGLFDIYEYEFIQ